MGSPVAPKSSIFMGFAIINHPCWGSPIFKHTDNIQCMAKINPDSLSYLHNRLSLRLRWWVDGKSLHDWYRVRKWAYNLVENGGSLKWGYPKIMDINTKLI